MDAGVLYRTPAIYFSLVSSRHRRLLNRGCPPLFVTGFMEHQRPVNRRCPPYGHPRFTVRRCPSYRFLSKLKPNCFPAVLCWDLGLFYFFGCCLVNSCGGLFRWIHLALDSTWEGAPCQVGTRLVKLAGLSSKSTCNICCIWSSGCSFGSCIPVSSLQYQLIGKLLGSGSFSQ